MRLHWKFLTGLACVVILIGVFWTHILWALGAILVNDQQPEKADVVLVLGGDFPGGRLTKAMELVRAGYAPSILISGPLMIYGVRERDLAIQYALAHGMRPDQLVSLVADDLSTQDEARDLIARMRRMGVRKYLLVTSAFHTGRAHRIFHSAAPDLEMRTVAFPDREKWCGGYWWSDRECRKTWFFEMTKNLANIF